MPVHPSPAKLAFLCLIAIVSTWTLGIAQQTEPVEYLQLPDIQGTRGGNLVAAVNTDPATFNRMLTSILAHTIIAERLSADLVHINRATFDLEPSLAKSWEPDKTGRIYTVNLRRGVRFSDGSPFTADDVLFTFQVLQDSRIETVFGGQIKVDGVFPAVTKIDAHTVKITFSRPVGMGLRMLDSIPIFCRNSSLKAYQEGKFEAAWGPSAPPQEIVGLGAFRLKEFKRGERVVLERNPFYWKKDKAGQILPYLDNITFLIIPDRNAEALRFKAGDIDVIDRLNAESYADLRRSEGRYRLQDLGPGLLIEFLWFNLNRGANAAGKPFVDPEKRALFEKTEFRRAVSHAIDRDGMARSLFLGLGTSQYGPISSGNKAWYHAGIPRTEFDPSRADSLLNQLDLKDTDGDGVREFGPNHQPLEFTLLTARGNTSREKMAEVIQQNLAKVGIRMQVQSVLPNELGARVMESFDYEAILFGFTPTDVAPDLQADVWYSSGEHHFWCPRQPKPLRPWEAQLDQLTTKLIRSMSPTIRKETFAQIQDLWARECPGIPTVAPNMLPGWSARIGNVRPSIVAPHVLWNAEVLTKNPRAVAEHK
ncbi:MAG TPA: ABC transporter substrate-binding protein [Acidobacteriota bacterium]|nr:ABC transporter substrate-binding protein [Acidobacteriota bacterium]